MTNVVRVRDCEGVELVGMSVVEQNEAQNTRVDILEN